jgi:3-oxoacyl-[acyl-carrier protein] reductase
MDLQGKTAIVTGSGRGIGRKTAITLAGEGCNVVLVSRTQKEVQEVEKTIRNKGGEAFHLAADISKKKDIEHVINIEGNERRRVGLYHKHIFNSRSGSSCESIGV